MLELKWIQWYEWKYSIDTLWNVYSVMNQMFLKPSIKNWYLFVILQWKNHYIHRLIAKAFIPNPLNLPCINHKDWNKLNNALDNIEWCTYQYNLIHARRMWLNKTTKNHVSLKKLNARKVSQYTISWIFIASFESATHAHRETWASRTVIWRCCMWKAESAWWYFWKFIL